MLQKAIRYIKNPYNRPYHYHKVPEKILNAKEINSILTKHEKTFHPTPMQNSVIKRIDFSALPSNSPMEDSQIHSILKDGTVLLGVLDGHWSNDCAKLVTKSLPLFIENESNESVWVKLLNAFQELDKSILDLPWTLLPELNDKAKIKSMSPSQKLDILMQLKSTFSGSCAVVAHINKNELHVAHAGDWY
jgi:serine/threonine protein phosphatase PrpC